MSSFLLTLLVGSVILTVVLNVVPRMFPGPARKAEQKLHDYLLDAEDARSPASPRRKVQVYFPWKGMLIASVVLTVLVNLGGLFF